MKTLFALGILVLFAAGCVVHPGHHPRTQPRVTGDVQVTPSLPHTDASVTIVFSDRDRRLVTNYYRSHTPPGLAKKGKTPPGLAKKGKTPPGHIKRLERHQHLERHRTWSELPGDLKVRLAPLPRGYIHIRVEDSIAIMELNTRLILDVLHPF